MVSRLKSIITVRRMAVFRLDAVDQIIEVRAGIPVEIQPVTPQNCDRVTDFRMPSAAQNADRMLRHGHVGVYAWYKGNVVGHAWAAVCAQGVRRIQGYFQIKAGESVICVCNVREDLRGNRVYPAMLCALSRALFTIYQAKTVFIDTAIDNAAAISGIRKVGFAAQGRLFVVQCCGRPVFSRMSAARQSGGTHNGKS